MTKDKHIDDVRHNQTKEQKAKRKDKTSEIHSTAYDDAFKTMLKKGRQTLFPVLNIVFEESFDGKEVIVFKADEHHINKTKTKNNKITSDANFSIQCGNVKKEYLFECQNKTDPNMLVRLFEYALAIAVEDKVKTQEGIDLTVPNIGILYLQRDKKMHEKMHINVTISNLVQQIPVHVMQLQDYTEQEILSRNLLFLAPFMFFLHKDKLSMYNTDKEARMQFVQQARAFFLAIEKEKDEGRLDEDTYSTIIESSKMVYDKITESYDVLRKEVQFIVGGKVVELPFERERRIAAENTVRSVKVMLSKKMSYDDIAEISGLSKEEIAAIDIEKVG